MPGCSLDPPITSIKQNKVKSVSIPLHDTPAKPKSNHARFEQNVSINQEEYSGIFTFLLFDIRTAKLSAFQQFSLDHFVR